MNMKKTALNSAMALALGTIGMSAQADLSASASLDFIDGFKTCVYGGTAPDNCKYTVVGNAGSWFSMDADGSGTVEPGEITLIGKNDGVHMGNVQGASGSHGGAPDGSESPGIDAPWTFFSNTGMSFTVTAPTVVNDFGATKELDFSGWRVTWAGIPEINMGGGFQDCGTATDGICVDANLGDIAGTYDNGSQLATITCDTVSCSQSSTFVLDYAAVVPQADASGFGGVPYVVHLEGHVGTFTAAVPVPAAVWLFGSGLVGLVGVARRRKVRT